VAAGRSERNGHEKAAVATWRREGAQVVATEDSGSVRVALDSAEGLHAPEELRSMRRAIWRGEH
jgi:hypothetical protein